MDQISGQIHAGAFLTGIADTIAIIFCLYKSTFNMSPNDPLGE